MDRTGSPQRNPYADLLRIGAICAVMVGHWLMTDITYQDGRLSGRDTMEYVHWTQWLTLLLQVVPVFFLIGGFANATSWSAFRDRGEDWTSWVQTRFARLIRPTVLYVAFAVAGIAAAAASGVSGDTLAQASWFVALHLWFLPVYLAMVALTPLMLALHRRFGFAVPLTMAAGAASANVAVQGYHHPLAGYANYFLVWGAIHQWGFAWQDGSLTRRRAPQALAVLGLAGLFCTVTLGPYPIDMVGAGQEISNTTPPTIALLSFAAVQAGVLLALEPAGNRLLARRPSLGGRVTRLNKLTIEAYLWHMTAVVIVAVALYPSGLIPQPPIGSAHWWELRAGWCLLLAVIVAPIILLAARADRWAVRQPPTPVRRGPWSSFAVAAGFAGTAYVLSLSAVHGFAPNGHISWIRLGIFVGAVILATPSGHVSAGEQRELGGDALLREGSLSAER